MRSLLLNILKLPFKLIAIFILVLIFACVYIIRTIMCIVNPYNEQRAIKYRKSSARVADEMYRFIEFK